MKPLMFTLAAVLAFAVYASTSVADEKKDDKPAASKPATQAAIVNKKCPITGEDIDPKGKTVTYQGKRVGFCCDDCIEKFEKNPEKYMKDLK